MRAIVDFSLCNADTKCRWNPNAGHEQCIVDMNIEVELEQIACDKYLSNYLAPAHRLAVIRADHCVSLVAQSAVHVMLTIVVLRSTVLEMPTRDRIDAVNRLANHSSFDATVTELFRRELDHQNLGSSSVYVQWQTDASNIVSGLGTTKLCFQVGCMDSTPRRFKRRSTAR